MVASRVSSSVFSSASSVEQSLSGRLRGSGFSKFLAVCAGLGAVAFLFVLSVEMSSLSDDVDIIEANVSQCIVVSSRNGNGCAEVPYSVTFSVL